MNRSIFNKLIAFLCLLSMSFTLSSCGTNKAKKGYDLYVEDLARNYGTTRAEMKKVIENGLFINYVYVKDTKTYCYKGSYGYGESTTFYFTYFESNNLVGTYNAEELYELALQMDSKDIKHGTLTFN